MTIFDTPYSLSPEQKSSFESNGYLVLTDVLNTDDTASVQKWAAEVKALPNIKGEHMHYEEVRRDGSIGHFRTESKAAARRFKWRTLRHL